MSPSLTPPPPPPLDVLRALELYQAAGLDPEGVQEVLVHVRISQILLKVVQGYDAIIALFSMAALVDATNLICARALLAHFNDCMISGLRGNGQQFILREDIR